MLVKAGKTDVSVELFIADESTGAPATGLAYNSSGIDLKYRREFEAAVSITEATLAALTTAHADGGFKEIGNGWYRLDLPDDAVDTTGSSTSVVVYGTITGYVVYGPVIQLVAFDPANSVRLGLTALPNAAADAAGGLPISDAGGLDLDSKLANTNEVTTARMGALTDWINGGRLDNILDACATASSLSTVAGYLDTEIAAILADTNELQTDWANGGRLDLILDATATASALGAVDTLVNAIDATTASIQSVTNKLDDTLEDDAGTYRFTTNALEQIGDLPTNAELATALAAADDAVLSAIAALNNLSAAQVNAEVLDVMNVDTFAEPSQGAPAATTSLATKIGWIYSVWRNKKDQTATLQRLFADNGSTVICKADVADDGTTTSVAEQVSGA